MSLSFHFKKSLSGPNGPLALDISLEVQRGETLALFGPSGAGKTSILRMVAGLMMPDSCELSFCGKDWTDVPSGKRNTGFVFQDYALFPNMTVRKNLLFAANGVSVEEIILAFGLKELEDKFPQQLSGGQQQRVALARALVQSPDVLLLDEPLSALDDGLRRQLRTYLKQAMKATGMTALLVSHDIGEILQLADRVAILSGGEVAACGRPEELLLTEQKNGRVLAEILQIDGPTTTVRIGNQRLTIPTPPGTPLVGQKVSLLIA
jgi:molybdate transport system ATP-binding protein